MTSPRLTAGTLRTCSRLALHQDSHLPPASQARVPFLPVCFVFHLFSEEKTYLPHNPAACLPPASCLQRPTYPTTRQPASHQPAVYRVHRWPQEWQGRLHVTHYNPAAGLGGEAFWPAADSSLQRNKETEQSQAPLCWVPGEAPGLLQYFLQFPPSLQGLSLQRTEEVARLRGLCPLA